MTDTGPADTVGTMRAEGADLAGTVRAYVPELVGVTAVEAHDRALDAGLLAVAENATHTAAGRGRIERQDPEAGTEVEHGGIVRIWVST